MTDVGPWGAWQIEPSQFTKLVVDSMKKLSVRDSVHSEGRGGFAQLG